MKNRKIVMCTIAVFLLCVSMIISVHADTLSKKCKGKHSWKEISNSATCTKGGTKKYKCKKCDATKTETIKKLGHNWSKKIKKIDAYKHQTEICSRCGAKKTQKHSPTKDTKNSSMQKCKCGAKRKVIVLKGRKMTTKEWNK